MTASAEYRKMACDLVFTNEFRGDRNSDDLLTSGEGVIINGIAVEPEITLFHAVDDHFIVPGVDIYWCFYGEQDIEDKGCIRVIEDRCHKVTVLVDPENTSGFYIRNSDFIKWIGR